MLLSSFILALSLIAAGSAQVEYYGTSNVRNQVPNGQPYPGSNRAPLFPNVPTTNQRPTGPAPPRLPIPGAPAYPNAPNYPPSGTINNRPPYIPPYQPTSFPSIGIPNLAKPMPFQDNTALTPNKEPVDILYTEAEIFSQPNPDRDPEYYPEPEPENYPQPAIPNETEPNTAINLQPTTSEPEISDNSEPEYPESYPQPGNTPDIEGESVNIPGPEPSYYPDPANTPVPETPDPGYYPQPGNTPASESDYNPQPGNTPDPEPGPQPETVPVRPSNDPEWPNNRPISGEYLPNFNCENGDGFYTVPNNCDIYVECRENVAYKQSCPDGLHFKAQVPSNEYPCAYPSESKCPEGSETQPPFPTTSCPRQYGLFSMSDGECSKFFMCDTGIVTVMDCPQGLVFNEESSSCDWPENVPWCKSNAFKDFKCPEAEGHKFRSGWMSDIIYKYKYEDQCKLYIACQRGYPRLLSCDPGLLFDENLQTCIAEEYVNCAALS